MLQGSHCSHDIKFEHCRQ